MVQLHAIHHGVASVRPTNDVDIVVHVESGRGRPTRVAITTDSPTTVSVPDPYGALILKAAAHRTDTRDRERHLLDAAVLLACIDDPFAELEREPSGSDRSRVLHLREHLADPLHVAWLQLDAGQRADAQAALGILTRS